MGKHQNYEKRTEQLVLPILEQHGFEFVDIEFIKEAGSWHLRAYIDKEGGITIDDLTLVNHALSDLLDQEDFIEESYILEVSSPGLLRAFKKPRDYIRNLGNDVEGKLYAPVAWEKDGKQYTDKEFIGILKEYDENTVTKETGDGTEKIFDKSDIALIRLAFDF